MMMPIAPAICASDALNEKVHPPRSMNAIFPASGVVILAQPSAGETAMTSAAMLNDAGPNDAAPVLKSPPVVEDESIRRSRLPTPSQTNICIRGRKPSGGVLMFALLRPE